jgi:uncharacterized protein with GYD domain
MATYIILSSISAQAFSEPSEFKGLAQRVSEGIKRQCPGVTWKESYSTAGRFDVVDIVECEDLKEVEKAAMIIRGQGRARTEILVATPWKEFLAAL